MLAALDNCVAHQTPDTLDHVATSDRNHFEPEAKQEW